MCKIFQRKIQEQTFLFAYIKKKQYFCRRFMDESSNYKLRAMYRRWLYMILAIVVSALMFKGPVFSFQQDKGILYIRSFAMDQQTFYVIQTDLKTNVEEVVETMSVKGLYYCNWALLTSCIACFLCFFSSRWRMSLCVLAVIFAGAYYIIMIYYAMQITENYFATLTPNLWAVLPAIVLQLMLIVRRNVLRKKLDENENEEWADVPTPD